MERSAERGSSLIETAIAVAIVALVAGAALDASIAGGRAAGAHAVRGTLHEAARRELQVARDVLKYGDAAIPPASVATTEPMTSGSPLAVRLSIQASPRADGALAVSVTATSIADSAETETLQTVLADRVPLPGSRLRVPGLAPAPTGAP